MMPPAVRMVVMALERDIGGPATMKLLPGPFEVEEPETWVTDTPRREQPEFQRRLRIPGSRRMFHCSRKRDPARRRTPLCLVCSRNRPGRRTPRRSNTRPQRSTAHP